jgi:AraC-type transcriptional regulator N-terminus
MSPTAPEAREYARRAPAADGRKRRRKPGRRVLVAGGTSLNDISLAAPGALALRSLANRIARYAPNDGVCPLLVPGTYTLRRGRITSERVYATMDRSLCIVAQGAKVLMLGSEVLEYDPTRMLVFAVDLPVSGQLTRASRL